MLTFTRLAPAIALMAALVNSQPFSWDSDSPARSMPVNNAPPLIKSAHLDNPCVVVSSLPIDIMSWTHVYAYHPKISKTQHRIDPHTLAHDTVEKLRDTFQASSNEPQRELFIKHYQDHKNRSILRIQDGWPHRQSQSITPSYIIVSWVDAKGENAVGKRIIMMPGGGSSGTQKQYCNLEKAMDPDHPHFAVEVYV